MVSQSVTGNGGGGLSEAAVDVRVALYAPTSGTFTPVLWDATASSSESQTYVAQAGQYRKIGDMVHYWLTLEISSLGTLTTSEQASVGGLPFTADTGTTHYPIGSIGYAAGLAISAGVAVGGYVGQASTKVLLTKFSATAGTSSLLVSEFTAFGRIILSGAYIAA